LVLKIAPGSSIDLSRFSKPKSELEVYYGLPRDVKFCKKCNMSNQQPMSSNEYAHSNGSTKTTLSFDEEGVCHACRFNILKEDGEIDWDERERRTRRVVQSTSTRPTAPMTASSVVAVVRTARCSLTC